LNSSVIRTRYV